MDAKGFVIPSGGGSVLSMAPGRRYLREGAAAVIAISVTPSLGHKTSIDP